jgi:hypothetical protein
LVSHVKGRTYRLRMCENRNLRRIFGPKKEEEGRVEKTA